MVCVSAPPFRALTLSFLWRPRPRSSMMTFAGAPWKKPKPFEYISGPTVHPRPEYLRVYKRFLGLPDNSQAPRKSSGSGFTNNYVQSELNPGVAMDNSTQKYRLLLFENGIPVAKGAFFTDEDAMQGYSGYTDMMTKGPHGIHGVPLSASNNGPPGLCPSFPHHPCNTPSVDA
eukprot:1750427-Rhodomonas_salina.1